MKNMNEEIGFIEKRLLQKGVRLTPKGRRWADNAEGIAFVLLILLVFGVVGSIESGKWF